MVVVAFANEIIGATFMMKRDWAMQGALRMWEYIA